MENSPDYSLQAPTCCKKNPIAHRRVKKKKKGKESLWQSRRQFQNGRISETGKTMDTKLVLKEDEELSVFNVMQDHPG